MRRLSTIAAISGLYDFAVGVSLLFARDFLAATFGVPQPVPAIHADLNGLFLIAIAVGYVLPFRDPHRYRGYLWIMGPFLKGAGALFFVADHFLRQSPASFLVFAASDGVLAIMTWWALVNAGSGPGQAARRPDR